MQNLSRKSGLPGIIFSWLYSVSCHHEGGPSRKLDSPHMSLCQQQYKNPLHNLPLSAIMKQETAEANKGRARRAANSPRPYAGERTSHTADYCAVPILSNNHGLFKREKWECVFSFRRCRDKLQTLRRFCCLGGPEQSPRGTGRTHPHGLDR